MTYEDFNDFCRSLYATTYVEQWGGSHVWKVGGKVFAVGGWSKSGAPAFSFKTSELNFEILKNEPGYRPAPYLASRGLKWIQVYDGTPGAEIKINDIEVKKHLESSYRIICASLTKKKRKELGINIEGNFGK